MAMNEQFAFRTPKGVKKAFEDKCKKANRSSADVAREILAAFLEGRLRIINQPKNDLELYQNDN